MALVASRNQILSQDWSNQQGARRFQGGFWYLSVFEDACSGALPWTAATTLPGRRFRFWKFNR